MARGEALLKQIIGTLFYDDGLEEGVLKLEPDFKKWSDLLVCDVLKDISYQASQEYDKSILRMRRNSAAARKRKRLNG